MDRDRDGGGAEAPGDRVSPVRRTGEREGSRCATTAAAALAQRIVDTLERDLGYEHGAVLVVDPATRRLFPIALGDQGRGREFLRSDLDYVRSRAPRLGEGITGWVSRTGESVVSADVSRDRRYVGLRAAIRSEVAVPLRSPRGLLGVLNAESPRPGAYSDRDARVLELFAAQISMAIEHDRLHEQLERLTRLEGLAMRAAGAAHDMNNLLGVISGQCELLLLRLEQGKTLRAGLDGIQETALRAAHLTRELLAFRRSEDPRPRRTDIGRLVEELLPTLQGIAPPGVTLFVRPAPSLGSAYVDPAQFEQALMNLVTNAIHAMPEGGSLTIETADLDANEEHGGAHGDLPRGSYVTLTVRDTGMGMDEETRARLFEPFYTTRPDGNGLGLPSVLRTVQQHGGHVRFETEPGRGTTFRIHLPRL